MYLRTTRRRNKDGSTVEYYQLAHNVWDSEKQRSKVQILHNFGRADALDRTALVRLCHSIARVCGAEVRDLVVDGPSSEEHDQAPPVEVLRTRALGVAWVADAMWREVGIDVVLKQLLEEEGITLPYERVLFAIVANRLDEPTSKLGVCERWLETVHIPGAPPEWKRDWFYDAMDLCYRHADRIEEAVFFQVANLMNLAVDLVFFDTTTVSFAIDQGDEPDEEQELVGLRRLGHSKEGTWTPQVVVALAVTREGLPVRSWVFPGNTADVTVVERIREDLRGWKLHRVLMVGDAGMDSADNRAELGKACGRYVLAVRAASLKEVRKDVLSRPGRYKKVTENLRVKQVVVGEGEKRRRYLVCHNPAQAERQRKHREQVLEELEVELAQHRDADAQRKWVAQIRASGRYGRYVRLDKRGTLKIDRKAVREASRHDGKWVLITNDDSLDAADAAQAYKGLLIVERCFRNLKRVQLNMQPVYHWLERRVTAHVKLCVLALLLQRMAELRAQRSWMRVAHVLQQIQVAELQAGVDRFLQVSRLTDEAVALLGKLQIKPPKRVLDVSPG